MATDIKFPKPGIERKDVKPCAACGLPLLRQEKAPPSLQAYRVTFDMLMLDLAATRSYGGVMAILGGESQQSDMIANAMAPDTELLKCYDTMTAVVCQACYFNRPPIELAMSIRSRRDAEGRA